MDNEQHPADNPEKFSNDPTENLRIENAILRIKVKTELGGEYESDENLSVVVSDHDQIDARLGLMELAIGVDDTRAEDVAMLEPEVLADSVIDVHHQIADRERAEVFDERARGIFRRRTPLRATLGARTEDFFFRDDDQPLGR